MFRQSLFFSGLHKQLIGFLRLRFEFRCWCICAVWLTLTVYLHAYVRDWELSHAV